MPLNATDDQVIRLAVKRAEEKMQRHMNVRTAAVVELGGAELISESDKRAYDNAPDEVKHKCVCTVKTLDLKALLEGAPT